VAIVITRPVVWKAWLRYRALQHRRLESRASKHCKSQRSQKQCLLFNAI